jgi:hypothetical protein
MRAYENYSSVAEPTSNNGWRIPHHTFLKFVFPRFIAVDAEIDTP